MQPLRNGSEWQLRTPAVSEAFERRAGFHPPVFSFQRKHQRNGKTAGTFLSHDEKQNGRSHR